MIYRRAATRRRSSGCLRIALCVRANSGNCGTARRAAAGNASVPEARDRSLTATRREEACNAGLTGCAHTYYYMYN
jgi:hypothetical protein